MYAIMPISITAINGINQTAIPANPDETELPKVSENMLEKSD